MSDENVNQKEIELDIPDTAAICMLLTEDWSQEIAAPQGRVLVIARKEDSWTGRSTVTRGYRTVRSDFEVYVKQIIPNHQVDAWGGDCAFLFEGIWGDMTSYEGNPRTLNRMILTDIGCVIESIGGQRCFATNPDTRVRRINVPSDPLSSLAEATIKVNNFKNLLNKAGRASGTVNLVMKEGKLSVVIDDENANCVESFYKAGNVLASDMTVGAATRYKAIYDFLYRRKQSHAGLLSMRLGDLVSEDVVFGILGDGRLFLRVRPNGLGHPTQLTVIMPRAQSNCNYEDLTINTKTVRKSSSSVPKKTETRAPVVLEEPVEEPSGSEFSEEEMARLELWHSVHEAEGGTSTDHKQWFASFVMYQVRQGLEVSQEDLLLATKL